jgi:hypothetical protein
MKRQMYTDEDDCGYFHIRAGRRAAWWRPNIRFLIFLNLSVPICLFICGKNVFRFFLGLNEP